MNDTTASQAIEEDLNSVQLTGRVIGDPLVIDDTGRDGPLVMTFTLLVSKKIKIRGRPEKKLIRPKVTLFDKVAADIQHLVFDGTRVVVQGEYDEEMYFKTGTGPTKEIRIVGRWCKVLGAKS